MDGLNTESGDPRLNIHGTVLTDGFWKGMRNTRPEEQVLDSEAYAHNLRSFGPSRAEGRGFASNMHLVGANLLEKGLVSKRPRCGLFWDLYPGRGGLSAAPWQETRGCDSSAGSRVGLVQPVTAQRRQPSSIPALTPSSNLAGTAGTGWDTEWKQAMGGRARSWGRGEYSGRLEARGLRSPVTGR
jgi:hypothetical protein